MVKGQLEVVVAVARDENFSADTCSLLKMGCCSCCFGYCFYVCVRCTGSPFLSLLLLCCQSLLVFVVENDDGSQAFCLLDYCCFLLKVVVVLFSACYRVMTS